MRTTVFIASILVGLGVSAAQAADMPRGPVMKAPMMAPLPMWQGWYAGIHGGYGWGDADRSIGATDVVFTAGEDASHGVNGGIFGGHAGYNWQVAPNYLFGLEASIAWSGIDGGKSLVLGSVSSDLEWIATFTPRLGWINNNWLFYVKGGIAGGRVEMAGIDLAAPTTFSASHTHVGWTAGAGIEVLWSPNWIFGIEYNYYDLGTESVGGLYADGASVLSQRNDLKFSSVLARLSYKY
jgi:outer membrane immunogenic protein